jgi:hypothetical protein
LLTEIGKVPPLLPSILKEDNTGAIFMAKNTAIGQRTKHVDVRYRFVNDMVLAGDLLVDHIRSGENPSDCMTKNLPLALHAKHAGIIHAGMLADLYDSRNTEDVEPYGTTVAIAIGGPSTVVDEYSMETICSVDSAREQNDAWIVVGKSQNKRKAERAKGA